MAVVSGLVLLLVGCGGGSGTSGSDQTKTPLTIGGFDFTESSVLAHVYADALRAAGYEVDLRLDMGNREVVQPAIERGEIDLYAGYAASEFGVTAADMSSRTADEIVDDLRALLKPKGLTVLQPSAAVNTNAFAVTRATAERYGLTKLSQLTPLAPNLVFGGPPECPSRPFCAAGLARVYDIHFKELRSLDAGGPLSKEALTRGDADVVLIFSTDGSVLTQDIVVLEDDKGLQAADNVVPVIREEVATSGVRRVLDKVSAALETSDLVRFNKRAEDEDLEALALGWLRENGISGKAR